MDKSKIKQLCEQIARAADGIVSIGAAATQMNAAQIVGIQRAARMIAAEIDKPDEADEEVQT